MTGAQQTMLRAVQDALRRAGRDVREEGWPVEMLVDYVADRDTYAVLLRVELPPMPRPVDATDGGA